MNEEKLSQIESEIEPLIKRIVLDLRPEKIINPGTFKELHEKLDAYRLLIEGQSHIPRSFAGKVFYLFNTLIIEASYKNYDAAIMDEVFKLQPYLYPVFDENLCL
ncbi:hypothetical protein K0T92_07395 [Paenibacillus oenotherae]|uniref:Uncharacterized protein n=1 Tax=Paenibacillus oenotherae TaxID=1435645 RepID=A0ABS7D419_9BACL|nr:hypothetical protein [Paenibacillus oenotherae]MBW7474566.1 hypothetical protein [Paenibacillus oenotherae]